jgi:hypothetical protein
MVRLKSVGVLSVAKLSALVHAAMSLLAIPLFIVIAAITAAMPQVPNQPPAILFVIFAVAAPFFYGAVGFVVGALGAFIYNLAAGWLGGIEMQFEPAMTGVWPQPLVPAAPATPEIQP